MKDLESDPRINKDYAVKLQVIHICRLGARSDIQKGKDARSR